MNARWPVILGVTTILALGAMREVGSALPIRPVYLVVEINEIINTAEYEVLKKAMGPRAVVETQFANGRYLARTEDTVPLDGPAPRAIVIIAFDSESKAKSFYDATKEITALRLKASNSRSFIVGRCSEGGTLSSGC
jgi:uncharacterized protein (DUF1330 family)